MNNWAKLLKKENNILKQEAILLREKVNLMKKFTHLKTELKRKNTKSKKPGFQKKSTTCDFTFSSWEKLNSKENLLIGPKHSPSLQQEPKPHSNQIPSNSNQEERPLLESFESYYESEEENLDKNGKCELSYNIYKDSHQKGLRRSSKPFQNIPSQATAVFPMNLHRKSKKSAKKPSISLKDMFHTRCRSCRNCDNFLFRGLPSSKCRKHSQEFNN